MKKRLLNLILILGITVLAIQFAGAPPPETKTVRGTIFARDSSTQMESGISVFINDTNLSITTTSETYGPPGNSGAYSSVLNSSSGDIIYVRAWNETDWGYKYGIMGLTSVTIDVSLNISRDSEAIVNIISPQNDTAYNSEDKFNLTVNITIVGNNGINCNATISFSTPGVLAFDDDTATHYIGNINRGTTITESWNLSGFGTGSTNISVIAACGSDGFSFEESNRDIIYNISSLDNSPPVIDIISPENNTRVNNPVTFYYNVTDGSPIKNCSLTLNSVLVNVTDNPTRGVILNFTQKLTQKNNSWEIICIDDTPNKNLVSEGFFNLNLNDFPFITGLEVEDPVNLIAASTKRVFCNGTVTDGDGYADISIVNATLFFQSSTSDTDDNPNTHYSNTSCRTYNSLGDNIDFSCSFDMEYFSNNGTWYCNVSATDIINSTNSSQISTKVNDLLAIGITPNIIDYGDLEILQISPIDIPINITNWGNIELDINLFAYAQFQDDNLSMDCTQNNISFEYERFSTEKYTNYNLMTPVNNSDNAVYIDLNVSKSTGSVSSKQLFWKLQIPLRTFGTCNGKVIFTALPS